MSKPVLDYNTEREQFRLGKRGIAIISGIIGIAVGCGLDRVFNEMSWHNVTMRPNASQYSGSLVGKTIRVDPVLGADFNSVYGSSGFSASEEFRVIHDEVQDGIRIIDFQNKKGIAAFGTAKRFDVEP